MGWSGKTGTVSCAACTRNADGSYTTGAYATATEVLSWDAELIRKVTGYLHSESSGWEDTALGGKMLKGTIEVKLQLTTLIDDNASGVVALVLSNAAIVLSGLAVMESVPISTKIDGGEAVSATYRFRSKMAWITAPGNGSDENQIDDDEF